MVKKIRDNQTATACPNCGRMMNVKLKMCISCSKNKRKKRIEATKIETY